MNKYIIGVDIGGSYTKISLFNEFGIIEVKWELKTDVSTFGENIIKDTCNSIINVIHSQKISKEQILSMGVGVPAPVINNSFIVNAVNLGWKMKNVKDEFESILGIKTVVENDANLAALGEKWQGAGKDLKDICLITLGTGIGGGIISNNKLISGAHGSTGEFGHIKLYPNSNVKCACGGYGCFESFASAKALVANAKSKLKFFEGETKLKSPISPIDIFKLGDKEDALALLLIEDYCKHLAWGISIISSIFDPQAIIIGGGISNAGDILLQTIKRYYAKFAYKPTINTEIKLTTLGNDSGMYGAAFLALEAI